MEVEVNELIKNEVERLNKLFQKAAKSSRKQLNPFSFDDYVYLKEPQEYFGVSS